MGLWIGLILISSNEGILVWCMHEKENGEIEKSVVNLSDVGPNSAYI